MRVRIVDNEPDIVEIVGLTFALRWPDAEVLHARTGAEGIEIARRDAPAMVILDIGLPGGDGFAVCERIRRFSDVPIIMLTARHNEVDKVRDLELGADDYVTKPLS